jgi:uncharacterized protein (TIGR02270 family)
MAVACLIPDIIDQHYENSASLWLMRDNAVEGPLFKLSDLVRLDERIEANVDGLRIAKTCGWSASPDDLKDGEGGSFFVAGVLAAEGGDPGRFNEIIELAYASSEASKPYNPAYDPWRGLVSALAWVDRTHAQAAIERLLDTPRPRTRWLGVAACGVRRAAPQHGLEAALTDREPLVRARAARTIGELGRTDLRAVLNSLLGDPDESCRFWAAWSAALLGTTEGLRALAEIAAVSGAWCEPALDLLLRRLPIEDAKEFLRPIGRDRQRRRTVLRATAMIGDPLYLPWLIDQINELTVARRAGEAFATITGVDVDDFSRDPPFDFDAEPNDDPDDEAVVQGEDEGLAWLDSEKCRRWWEANGARFRTGTAYFKGEPKPSVNWIGVLAESRQEWRRAAALELALLRTGQAMFNVCGRGDLQQRLLRRAGGSPS